MNANERKSKTNSTCIRKRARLAWKVNPRISVFICGLFVFAFPLWLGASSAAGGSPLAPPRRVTISPWDVEAREYLGTPQSEAAVSRGLAYLAASQRPDGHWQSGGYRN